MDIKYQKQLSNMSAVACMAALLANRESLRNFIEVDSKRDPSNARWSAASYAAGSAGIAGMWAELGIKYSSASEKFLKKEMILDEIKYHLGKISEEARTQPVWHPGITTGMSGILLSLAQASDFDRRFIPTLEKITRKFLPSIQSWLSQPLEKKLEQDSYDAISGVSGIIFALDCVEKRLNDEGIILEVRSVVNKGAESLVTRSLADDPIYLTWSVPPSVGLLSQSSGTPERVIDMGMAHGLPGISSAICMSMRFASCTQKEDMREAIRRILDFIIDQAREDDYGINWPACIDVSTSQCDSSKARLARTAWCYGSPGVAIALYNGAVSLSDRKYLNFSASAMSAASTRYLANYPFRAPTICHGASGFLAVMKILHSRGLNIDNFNMVQENLNQEILRCYLEENLFGIQDYDPDQGFVDNPGLLSGTAGVILALSEISEEHRPWHSWLGIAEGK